ncbi:MAG: cytochrome P450 [Rudaea sp.]
MAIQVPIERQLDPFPYYRQMRESSPVYFDRERWSWNVFKYDDVQEVLSVWKNFSSQFGGSQQNADDPSYPFAASMISSDPPRHRKLRNLVTQAFTPRAVEALAPRIQSLVDSYLDRIMKQGRMDVIADLGYPLPVTVIAEMLGIPSEDREQFKRWSDSVVAIGNFGDNMDLGEFSHNTAVMQMSGYFMQMIQKRKLAPGEDLISGLLAANIDGERLSLVELLGFCVLLLVAGNETTTNLIGNALLAFTEHPEAWQHLRDHPDLLVNAIEEVLRYRSPVQAMFRRVANPVELRGQAIPANSPAIAWIGSANHDEEEFPEASRFDITRTPNRHLAFGHGIHYCLGAPLARLEARIALGAMVQRFATVSRVPGVELERLPSLIVYGVRSLPITFST